MILSVIKIMGKISRCMGVTLRYWVWSTFDLVYILKILVTCSPLENRNEIRVCLIHWVDNIQEADF